MAERAQVLVEAVDRASETLDKVERKMGGLATATDKLKGALGLLGGALSIAAFTHWIEGAVEMEAHLYKLSLQTGITADTLSALSPIAKQSGTDIDSVASLVNKLEKSMLSFAQTGAGKTAAAWQQLGYTQEQVKEGLQHIDEFLPEFAKRLVETGVGGEKAGLAMQLMSRGGAQALPFLLRLAEAGELTARTTQEQAERAHDLEAAWVKLGSRGTQLKYDAANGLTPALLDISKAFIEIKGKGSDTSDFFETIGRVLRVVATAAGSFWFALKDMGDGIGAFAAQTRALLTFDLDAFRAIGKERDAQYAKNKAQFDDFQKRMLSPSEEIAHRVKPKPLGDIPGAPGAASSAGASGMTFEDLLARGAMKRLQVQEQAEQAAEDAFRRTQEQAARTNEELEKEAQKWKDIADPIEPLRRQLKEINDLYEQGRLNFDVWSKASFEVQEKIEKAMGNTLELTKETDDWAKKLGLTFTSAAEEAIRNWQGFGNLIKKIGLDVAQLAFRMTVTEPAGKAFTEAFKGTSAGGFGTSLFGAAGGALSKLFNFGGGDMTSGAPVVTTGDSIGYGSIDSAIDTSGVLGSFATGTDFVPKTGRYLLHEGERVTPSAQNAAAGATYYIDARNSDAPAIARLEQTIRNLHQSIEPRIAAWNANSWR